MAKNKNHFLIRIAINIASLGLTAYLIKGIKIDTVQSFIISAAVIAILNIVLKPILLIFTLPLTLLTLGAFIFVINSIIMMTASYLVPGFHVASFGDGLIGAIVISIINFVLNMILKNSDD
jgi:putative membrane protein